MIYKFDKHALVYRPVAIKYTIAIVATLALSITVAFNYGRLHHNVELLTDEERLIVINEHAEFTEEKLVNKLQSLNVKFPHIVFAQAVLETGNFSSKVFKENNNLFGMREAKQRITTAKGTENNHAYYHSWRESVLDYAFYQCRYLSSIRTEEQYLQYLSQSYAEDPNYIIKLKALINTNQIANKFK